MPRAGGCECRAKFSRIDSTNTEFKEIGWEGDGDNQCNRNEEEERSEEKVGQDASIFHLLLDVAWPRVSVRDIKWATGEQ